MQQLCQYLEEIMIIDKETNKVYFSYLSKYDFKKENVIFD